MNRSCPKNWFCFSHKTLSDSSSTSSAVSTPIDENLNDYCETNLDDIYQPESKQKRKQKRIFKLKRKYFRRFCCSKKKIQRKRLIAPLATLREIFSTSFSISSSNSIRKETTTNIVVVPTPDLSLKSSIFDRNLPISTPKSSIVHSYTSLSTYRLKSNSFQRNFSSLEEILHRDECQFCSSSTALSTQTDSNNNQFELFHAVELYLSTTNSSIDVEELSSMSSEQRTIMSHVNTLSLCEINEILYAIETSSETTAERNRTLDALALSLREVAEETPFHQRDLTQTNPPVIEVQQELGQILLRAVMYEVVMRFLHFYFLVLFAIGF